MLPAFPTCNRSALEAQQADGPGRRGRGLVDDLVWTIFEDRAGDVWIGTNDGLTHLSGDRATTNYTTRDGLPGPDIRALLEDHHGHLWIGTDANGLARLRDGRLEVFGRQDGLVDDQVTVLAEDARGQLWIGTEGGDNGVFGLFDKLDATSEGTGIGLALVERIVKIHGGRVWVESEGPSQGSTFFVTLPETIRAG